MNRTKIEWTDWTWNPVTGCRHDCFYCYGKVIANRFKDYFPNGYEPTFYPKRLKEPFKLKKPSKIFVVDMGDLFGDWVPNEWIESVIWVTKENPQHIFQFLTKNPKRYAEFAFPDNCWLGVTLDGLKGDRKRWKAFDEAIYDVNNICFVSFEPLLGRPEIDCTEFCLLNWAIVGAMTGPGARPYKKDWVEMLLRWATIVDTPIFLKDNLNWPEKIQQFPEWRSK